MRVRLDRGGTTLEWGFLIRVVGFREDDHALPSQVPGAPQGCSVGDYVRFYLQETPAALLVVKLEKIRPP